ncbi:hypothetical protein HKD37_20G057797 [Glycine soja]
MVGQNMKACCDFEIMDIRNNYFMVKFDNEDDQGMAMDDGPWMNFNDYYPEQAWTHEFILVVNIDKTLVWICFLG